MRDTLLLFQLYFFSVQRLLLPVYYGTQVRYTFSPASLGQADFLIVPRQFPLLLRYAMTISSL